MTPPPNNNQLSISTLKVEYNNLSATEVKLVDSILKTPPKQFKAGMTARVFELPGNKICRIQSKTFTNKKISAMKAMANTLNWQMACIYANSKHVPKIYFVGFVGSKKSPSVVVTVMEKLASAHRYANNRMFEKNSNLGKGSTTFSFFTIMLYSLSDLPFVSYYETKKSLKQAFFQSDKKCCLNTLKT